MGQICYCLLICTLGMLSAMDNLDTRRGLGDGLDAGRGLGTGLDMINGYGLSDMDLQASFDLLNSPDFDVDDLVTSTPIDELLPVSDVAVVLNASCVLASGGAGAPVVSSPVVSSSSCSSSEAASSSASAVSAASLVQDGDDIGNKDSGRFETPLSESGFFASLQERIPKNTKGNTKWAVGLYKEWRMWRNFREETMRDCMWPIPSLMTGTAISLDYWLARFITEIKRQDNKAYNAGITFFYILLIRKFVTTIRLLLDFKIHNIIV